MVLEQDAIDRSGRVLLKAGTSLGERQLVTLKAWGITEVHIHGTVAALSTECAVETVDSGALREALPVAEALFTTAGTDHPAMAELFRIAHLRIARQLREAP